MDSRSRDGSIASLERVPLFGLNFIDSASLDEVADAILDFDAASIGSESPTLPVVLTPNVDIVVRLDGMKGSADAEMFEKAEFCLPDGQPIVAASRLFGSKLRARLPGSGLFEIIWPRIAAEDRSVVVVAPSTEISDRLGAEHPKANFIIPPMFDVDDLEAAAGIASDISRELSASGADTVIIGLESPKDVRIMTNLFAHWPPSLAKPFCICVGGGFAMYLGLKRRAPAWVQKIGMEWFFRFAQEPRRLFHRYFVRDVAFVGVVWRELRSRKRRRRSAS